MEIVEREQLHLDRRRSVVRHRDDHRGRDRSGHNEAAHDQKRPAGKHAGHAVILPGPKPKS